jgi:hypothetical protein
MKNNMGLELCKIYSIIKFSGWEQSRLNTAEEEIRNLENRTED